MFGYIIPDKPELKVKENELYKAYYCGLCRSIKKNIGNIPRLSLTYDFAFLAMLFSGIINEAENIGTGTCIASPGKKKPFISENDIMKYCAEMNVLLFYYKLKDNLHDDKNPLYLPIVFFFRLRIHKLLKKYARKSYIIEKEISDINRMEKRNENDIDVLSNMFGKMMEEIFSYGGLDCNMLRAARWMGFNLGKWIYVIDAYDDIQKDIKKKRFNPFVDNEKDFAAVKEKQRARVKEYLFACLEETSAAYSLLEIKKNGGILDNIIYSGLLKKTLERCHKDEKSV